MTVRILLAAALAWTAAAADRKPPATGKAGNEDISFEARAVVDKDEIKDLLGMEPGRELVVVEIKVTPRTDKPLQVAPEDFTLLSHKDGQKSSPFTPSQLAGKGALVVKAKPVGGGTRVGSLGGPGWGGLDGSRPRQLPGDAVGVGSGSDVSTANETQLNKDAKQSPLYAVLREKGLPERDAVEPVSGLLYFPIAGKVKGKELSLIYKGPAGRLVLEFQEKK